MKIDEKTIENMPAQALYSQEFVDSLLSIKNKSEKKRLYGLAECRAREEGILTTWKSFYEVSNQARDELAAKYSKENADKTGIELAFDGHNRPLVTVDNFLTIVKNDPKFAGLKFNLLTYSPEQVRRGVTEKWTDADDAEARRYIEKEYKIHSVQKIDDALRIVFAQNEYHPVRDLVNGFKWDGTSRICDFLHRWTKCEDTPYTREVSRLIFAGGIHRLYNPGCKFDDMPVLIGTKQGEGKSTLVRWLALRDEYFTEVNEFDGQRGIEAVEGAWICEVSELLAMTKAREQEAVKSYLTRLNDRYRMPFDKRVTDHPRQCVFIGTTNKEQFLTDKTGNRRFYPVKVNQSGYDLFDHEDEIKDYIRQCWAEAHSLYERGEIKPFADRSLIAEIREQQNGATEDDYRIGLIEKYLDGKTDVCALEIWKKAVSSSEFSPPSKKDLQEISIIMQSFSEWERAKKPKRFGEFGVQRYWMRRDNGGSESDGEYLEDGLPL